MATRIWIKLYLEILDDPKMGRLSDHLWRRSVELFLMAGRTGDANDGALPPVQDIAWQLRSSEAEILEVLTALAEIGIVENKGNAWIVKNFSKRQAAISSTERVHEYRKRKRNESETKRNSNSNGSDVSLYSDSDSISPLPSNFVSLSVKTPSYF